MREVLFRAKRLDNGEWIEGYYASKGKGTDLEKHFIVSSTFGSNTNAYPFYFTDIEVDPKTVCQYTGLTDKNGRKIFEGDIVRYTDEVIGKGKADEIKYNETHAAFCRLHKSEMGLQYLFIDEAIANTIEVIGNIFDNPDLIGE